MFTSLPLERQKMVEQEVIAGELIRDPKHCDEPNQATAVEAIIAIVPKDTVSDSFRRMESLHRQATSCPRKHSEAIGPFLEHYLRCAQAYLDIARGN